MEELQTFAAGAAGGAILGLLRAFMSTGQLLHAAGPGERKAWQFALSQLLVIVILGTVGGVAAWAFTGRAGNFITGFTSLSLFLLIAGNTLHTQMNKVIPEGGDGE